MENLHPAELDTNSTTVPSLTHTQHKIRLPVGVLENKKERENERGGYGEFINEEDL